MAYIYRNPHRQSLTAIDQEIEQRKQEIKWATQRLAELHEARKAVLPLAQAEADEEMTASLPLLCLRVLSFHPTEGVSANGVREGLRSMGVEVSAKNPLGLIYTTLGRLQQSGYVNPVQTERDKPAQHFQISQEGLLYLQQALR